jgi:hypothetical protein
MKIIRAKKAEKKSVAKQQLEMQITSAFPVNEELRLINLGIADKDNAEYMEYRLKIGEILETYRSKW